MRSAVPAAEALARPAARPPPNSGLTASFASAPPVKGSPARLSASAAVSSRGAQPRGKFAVAATPTARNSAPFHEDMVGAGEGDHGGRAGVARSQRHPERRRDHAHLADARIGEHGLRILLGDPDSHAVESGDESDGRQRLAPALQRRGEGQKADEADHARPSPPRRSARRRREWARRYRSAASSR